MFVEGGAPTDGELHALLHSLITQLMKLLKRLGALTEEMDRTCLAESDAAADQARTLRRLRAAVVTPAHRLRPAR